MGILYVEIGVSARTIKWPNCCTSFVYKCCMCCRMLNLPEIIIMNYSFWGPEVFNSGNLMINWFKNEKLFSIYRLLWMYHHELLLEIKLYLWKIMASDKSIKWKLKDLSQKITLKIWTYVKWSFVKLEKTGNLYTGNF